MRIAAETNRVAESSELDMLTIRRRVAKIKSRWAPEVAQSRAIEGARRRRELDAMVSELLGDLRADFQVDACDDAHGLTLVG
jgi:hypothetical protein